MTPRGANDDRLPPMESSAVSVCALIDWGCKDRGNLTNNPGIRDQRHDDDRHEASRAGNRRRRMIDGAPDGLARTIERSPRARSSSSRFRAFRIRLTLFTPIESAAEIQNEGEEGHRRLGARPGLWAR